LWLSEYVNKENFRHWGTEQPRVLQTTSIKPKRVTVWCAMCNEGIVGPYFSEQNVTGDVYKDMLEKFFIPTIQRLGI
jgi:hypothetical protein